MQRKLLLSYLTIIVLAICISAYAFWGRGYQLIYEQSKENHLSQTQMIADMFMNHEFDNRDAYKTFAKNYGDKYNIRITIIHKNGEVYADTRGNNGDNHSTREEVVKALNGEFVIINRYSETMDQYYSYSAIPVTNGEFVGVIRVSIPLFQLNAFYDILKSSIIYVAILGIIIAFLTAIFFAKILSKPINEVTRAAERISKGELNIRIYTREKEQIGRLAGAFNIMASTLNDSMNSLKKRNVELEAMLTSISDSVVAINNKSEVLFYNPSFLQLVKSQTNDLEGISLYNLLRNVAIFKSIDEVRKNSQKVVNEGTLSIANSNTNIIKVTATPLLDENRESLGILLIIEDITMIKKLENMRRDFVSNVTHELKTPLTSIRGFIETLKNGAIQNEVVANRFLDIIDIEAERLYILIKDILILSEIESKNEVDRLPCDLNTCIEDVVELLEPKLTKKVTIRFDKKPLESKFLCNPDRMKQLFINLIDNGIKYTEEGEIYITCTEENEYFLVKVKDSGIGIDEEHIERIFERFYRVDRGRSRKQGGTGLGLSIVKHIIELYNGRIEVSSTLGKGTQFTIYLPK